MRRFCFNQGFQVWLQSTSVKIWRKKMFIRALFWQLLNMGSTELNKNGTHEKGYSRGFCPLTPNVKSKQIFVKVTQYQLYWTVCSAIGAEHWVSCWLFTSSENWRVPWSSLVCIIATSFHKMFWTCRSHHKLGSKLSFGALNSWF